MNKEISNNRKILYYVGNGLTLIGVIMFLSVFFIVFTNPFSMFETSNNPMANSFIGFILSTIGLRGKAGSGLILDPKQAREDLKPYSTQVGGILNDVLDEVDLKNNNKEIIKIRCKSCRETNDEDAKYCKKCGNVL